MPRIVDHDERRRQICDHLLDIIAEEGVSGVTMRGIADRSGWSTGVINHYFRSRNNLLLGGLRRAAELLAQHNMRVLQGLNGLSALEQILEGSLPIDGRRLALCRIFFFFYGLAVDDPAIKAEVENYLGHWRKSAARAIRQAQDLGDISPEADVRAIAADLVGLADGLSIHALLDQTVLQRVREQSPVRYWIRQLLDNNREASHPPQAMPRFGAQPI